MPATKKKAPKKSVKKVITAVLTASGKKIEAKGDTVYNAVDNLKPQGVLKTKVTLTLKSKDKEQSRVLPPYTVNRLFNLSPTMREVAVQQVSTMFDV
jgi:hypothetical protein